MPRSRLVLFIAICSAFLFWAYLLIISLNQNSTFVHRMFESYRSTIPFFIITIFSLITDVLSIAQTRLFLRIFELYPTGISFLLLAYSDAVLQITVFIFVFSLGIAFSLLFIDATLYKDIPVLLEWRHPNPRLYPASRHDPTLNLRISWPRVNDPVYNDYHHDVGIGIGVITRGRSLNVDDAYNEDDFMQKHLRGVRGVEFERLATPRQWPVGCVDPGCTKYTYIAHVRPFYRIVDFGDLWGHGIVKAFTTVLVVASGHLLFFDPTWVYMVSAQSVFFDPNPLYISLSKTTSDERIGEIWAELVTHSNPLFKPAIPIPPFFISSLFLSFIIYSSALAFKLTTLSAGWSRKVLIKKQIKVSEKVPFTQQLFSD